MSKARLEAFTDAVIAIIMTVLVLVLKLPSEPTWEALWDVRSQFVPFLLSFVALAIYWINHHHVLQITKRVSGLVLWMNVLLILCFALFPFATEWMSEHVGQTAPEAVFAAVFFLTDLVWLFLMLALVKANGSDSVLAKTFKESGIKKNLFSTGLCLFGIIGAFFVPLLGLVACLLSLIPWVIPDKKIEKHFDKEA